MIVRNVLTIDKASLLVVLGIAVTVCSGSIPAVPQQVPQAKTEKVEVRIWGGHETDSRDRGRPVALVAGALGVPSEVFREAFSHVTPAPAGVQPDPAQVRRNKEELLNVLGRYGITNDRLDTVSNYYRYRREAGEMWPTTPAKAYAVVSKGVVTKIVITDAGSGYSSAPVLSIPGHEGLNLRARLSFGPDFAKNGSIQSITIPSK